MKYFDASKIKTFELCDLVNRTLNICSLKDEGSGLVLTSAFDVESGECFILKQHREPKGVAK